jgi:lipopolysaccharide transport system ATP-binding protein
MSRPIIEVKNISKRYRLGQFNAFTLREETERLLRRLRGGHANGGGADATEFWALSDVSFDVQPGEVLGIIGRNGAGKSTLLKILSRVTEPTNGEIRVRGRVASLLEVGTGFHPELTGRENIFLNGAILGMSRAEIKAKFDEIVAFAEVEKFLDTPVKRYSSGMYVRLAFAVAAHLEPEILVVDEVLAVGDAAFQKKCLGKMGEVAGRGRTVLFVSHNMSVVQHLCQRVILLKDGAVVCDDASQTAISKYLSDAVDCALGHVDLEHWTDRTTTGEARITRLEFDDGADSALIRFGGTLRIRMRARFDTPLTNPIFGVIIHNASGVVVSNVHTLHRGLLSGSISAEVWVEVNIQNLSLYPGKYLLSPWIMDSAFQYDIDYPRMCASFEITPAPGEFGDLKLTGGGQVFIPSEWKIEASC